MGHSPRTLIIHAGGPKTGSSAIQNYLEFNADSLAKCGIDYENRLGITQRDKINSGNGFNLLRALIRNPLGDNLVDVLNSYFRHNHAAICSSESFTALILKHEHWKLLYDHAEKNKIKIHIIFFIRDVVPFFISRYDQLVKRRGQSIDLFTSTKGEVFRHVEFLKKMEGFLDMFSLNVVHYDSNKTKLIEKFIEFLPLKSLPPCPENNLIVNRSLSRIERELLLRLNKFFDSKFSESVSDKMIYSAPNKKVDRPYDPKLIEYLHEKFSDDVTWVNDKFFYGQPVFKIIDEKDLLASQDKSTTDEGTEVHDLVLDWALEQISLSEQHIASLEQHIASLKKENRENALLRPLKNFLRPVKNVLKRRR